MIDIIVLFGVGNRNINCNIEGRSQHLLVLLRFCPPLLRFVLRFAAGGISPRRPRIGLADSRTGFVADPEHLGPKAEWPETWTPAGGL
jgi:hypothetical protein